MGDGGDWTDALRSPPTPPPQPEDGPADTAGFLAAFALHGVLGVVSVVAVIFGLFHWVDGPIDAAVPAHGDERLFQVSVHYPIREEIAKATFLGVGALVLASFPGLRLRTAVLPAFLAPALGIGLGFGVVETMSNGDAVGGGGYLAAAVFRLFGHGLCVGWTAFGLALALARRWWWAPPVGLACAMLLHGGNNHYGYLGQAGAQVRWLLAWALAFAVLVGASASRLLDWPPRPAPRPSAPA